MNLRPGSYRRKLLLTISGLTVFPTLLFFFVYLAINYAAIVRSCEKGVDHELMGVSVELAKRWLAGTGPYSRFGFRHPGPFQPYYYAFWENLLPLDATAMGKHLLGQLALNLFFLISSSFIFFRFVRPRTITLPFLAVAIACFWNAGRTFMHDYWNPSVLMAPASTFLLASAATVSGCSWALILQACAAVLLLHSHIGSWPFVVAIGGASLLFGMPKLLRGSRVGLTNYLLCAGLILFIPSIPALRDWYYSTNGGNFGRILIFRAKSDPGKTFTQALQFAASYYLAPFGLFDAPRSALRLAFLVLFIPWTVKLRNSFARKLRFLLLLNGGVAIYSATQIVGHYESYLMRFQLGTVAVAYVLLWLAVREHLNRIMTDTTLSRVDALAAALSVLLLSFRMPHSFTPREEQCGVEFRPYLEALNPESGIRYRVVLNEAKDRLFASGLILQLLRQEIEVCVDRMWVADYDRALVCEEAQKRQALSLHNLTIMQFLPSQRTPGSHVISGATNTLIW